jgi:hypothetical protein
MTILRERQVWRKKPTAPSPAFSRILPSQGIDRNDALNNAALPLGFVVVKRET